MNFEKNLNFLLIDHAICGRVSSSVIEYFVTCKGWEGLDESLLLMIFNFLSLPRIFHSRVLDLQRHSGNSKRGSEFTLKFLGM